MAGIFDKTAKKYKTLSPELKIPAILLLYIILISFRTKKLLLTLKSSILRTTKREIKINYNFSLMKRIPRTHLHKKNVGKMNYKSPSIFLKLKYFLMGIIFSTIFIFLPITTIIFLQELPNPRELSLKNIPQTTKIYDRNKILLYEIYTDQNRTLVSLSDIPKNLQNATLAIEDKNFYNHPGFDITSIIRALKENIINKKPIQGGSTITQQLIKSSFFTSEKKFSRKIKEIILAYWAERVYAKDQILEMYFNQVPYGGTAWGVEAASEVYFGKHVKELTLGESAFLAGITQAPSTYSPYNQDQTIWKKRQKEVLSRMLILGFINTEQKKKAEKELLRFKKPQIPLLAPHFVMYIKDILIKKHGISAVERGGLNVITSLDLKKQDFVQKIVNEEVEKNKYLNLTNGAALITDPKNGDVLAMVGSKNYYDTENDGNVNITTTLQQPGSTVKVITYSAAILKGLTPANMINDSPSTFPGDTGLNAYSPVNYDGKYFGRVTMRFALANSLNLPAVKILQRIGTDTMVELGKKMGVSTWTNSSNYGLSVTLGGFETTMLDMATVFGTLSNKGSRVDIEPILLITDAKGNVLEKKDYKSQSVLPEGVAYIISDILSDNQTRSAVFGSNSQLNIPGHKVAVKTGTTDNKRDNWTIGYTSDYVVTVWVGNNDDSPMNQALASGITGAAPIWHNVMVNLIGAKKNPPGNPPSDVIVKSCLGKTEYFYKGTENSVNCGFNPRMRLYSSQQ